MIYNTIKNKLVMKQIQKIKEYSWAITILMIFTIFINQCGISRDVEKLKKNYKAQTSKIDSLVKFEDFRKELRIEGLKSELRAIEASDRKILDVEKQYRIRKDIENLEKK